MWMVILKNMPALRPCFGPYEVVSALLFPTAFEVLEKICNCFSCVYIAKKAKEAELCLISYYLVQTKAEILGSRDTIFFDA